MWLAVAGSQWLHVGCSMSTLTVAQAKRDYGIGYLTQYEIKRWDLTTGGRGGWFVWLGKGNGAGWLVDARHKEPRQFRTLDAAVAAVEEIGFRVNVLWAPAP